MIPKNLERSCIIYTDIWSSKNELNPEEVPECSTKKFWFECKICYHDYQQRPNGKKNGRGLSTDTLYLHIINLKEYYLN